MIRLIKNKLGGKAMKKFADLRPKIESYFMGDSHFYKRTKCSSKCVIKQEIEFEDCKRCLGNNKTLLRSQQRFRVKQMICLQKKPTRLHLVQMRIQTADGVPKYPHG